MTKRTRYRARALHPKNPNPPPSDEQTVTTLALPTTIWTELKIRAAQERRVLREVCQRAIEAYLKTPVTPADRDAAL